MKLTRWGKRNYPMEEPGETIPADDHGGGSFNGALWENGELLKLISENTMDMIWLFDMDWNIIWMTPSVERVTGFTFDELKALSIEQRLTPQSLEQAREVVARELTPERLADPGAEISATLELELLRKDDSAVLKQITLSLIRDSDGKPTGYIGVGRDITECKAAEDRLRESEDLFRLYFEKSYDVIYSQGFDFKLLSVSPAVERFLGYRPEELVGRSFIELGIIAPESLEQAVKDTVRAQSGKRMSPASYVFVARDGTRKFGEVTASRLIKNGEAVGIIGILRDITERKMAEDALRKSQQKYHLIVDWMSDMVWTADTSLNITFCSPSVERLLGYTIEEFRRMTIDDYITPASLEFVWQEFAKELDREKQGADPDREMILEVDHIHKDGSIVTVEINANFVRDEDGEPVGLVGVSRDITERKKAEEALLQSEERFRKIFEDSRLGMAIIGLDFRFQRANRALCEMLGYSVEELSEFTFPDITHVDDVEHLVDKAVRMRAGQIGLLSDESKVNKKDGGFIWMSITASLMRDENGDPAYAIAMCEDITARKQMEHDRKRLNEELEWRVRERTSQLDAANKELEAFCYSVSHDLSTPPSSYRRILPHGPG